MSTDNDYEKEIELYLEKLRKIAWYQRFLMAPLMGVLGLYFVYDLYYTRSWGTVIVIGIYGFCAAYHWWDSRKTFAKIMRKKLHLQ